MVNQCRFDGLTRSVTGVLSRRDVLRGLAGAGIGLGMARLSDSAEAKRRNRKPKSIEGLCQKNGSRCNKPGKQCKQRYCLNTPFTVEAKWAQPANHDTYLFVPPRDATTGQSPYIYSSCNQANSLCEGAYPFACIDNDEFQTGDEITTIYQLLPGAYEYWLGLAPATPAGAVTVVLKGAAGRIVRQWASPANASPQIQAAWHIFDLDGRDGRITAIDDLLADRTPSQVYQPDTNVCPK